MLVNDFVCCGCDLCTVKYEFVLYYASLGYYVYHMIVLWSAYDCLMMFLWAYNYDWEHYKKMKKIK